MNFTSFLRKKLVDLLNERRIVVWYDPSGDFAEFVGQFKAPNCEVLLTRDSILMTRRKADSIYRLMNESENSAESGRCMLIYVDRSRGVREEEKMGDPFEVYAVAGAAFGDTENEMLESLARQAIPEKADEVSRLFKEGKPDIRLLDDLEKAESNPLLRQVFGTTSAADVIALALCDKNKAKAIDETPGCLEELLRLLDASIGFKYTGKGLTWKSVSSKVAEYVLFSEFVFDLPGKLPDSLNAVPRAAAGVEEIVFRACGRMRSDTFLRDNYMSSARSIEKLLRLPELMPNDFDPGVRDTFPCEERRLLAVGAEYLASGACEAALSVIDARRDSIWLLDPARTPAWTALERAAALLAVMEKVSEQRIDRSDLKNIVIAYTDGGICLVDRNQRLFENALSACMDEKALAPVVDICRRKYRETVNGVQKTFMNSVTKAGWPPEGVFRQTLVFNEHVASVLEKRERTAFFMVDSLRYEMGLDLGKALCDSGEVDVRYAAGVLPTITDCGMAALMPDAHGNLRLSKINEELVPVVGTRVLKESKDRVKLLADTYGDRFAEITLDELMSNFKKTSQLTVGKDFLVVRTQDPDVIGESLGQWRAVRYLSDVIGDIATGVKTVVSMGFDRVIITSDHGHMMFPEISPGEVVVGPSGEWLKAKRRCRLGTLLASGAGTTSLKAAHLGIQGDVEDVCFPLGYKVFSDGSGYFHGGLSLQEAIVPVILFRAFSEKAASPGKPTVTIQYRSERFTSRVIGLKIHLQSDIFGTPAKVRVDAFDGKGTGAAVVGEAADCDARDEKTHEVTLKPNEETAVPVLIDPDFDGAEIEVRISDPETRVVWARKILKNAMLD